MACYTATILTMFEINLFCANYCALSMFTWDIYLLCSFAQIAVEPEVNPRSTFHVIIICFCHWLKSPFCQSFLEPGHLCHIILLCALSMFTSGVHLLC